MSKTIQYKYSSFNPLRIKFAGTILPANKSKRVK
jgi:hypothetical protein